MKVKVMHNSKNEEFAKDILEKLAVNEIEVTEVDPDIVCMIGGDGTFLKCSRIMNYSEDICFVGINGGNLGYLQNVSTEEIDELVEYLKENNVPEIRNSSSNITLAKVILRFKDGKAIEDSVINELQISGKKYHKIEFKLSDNFGFEEEVLASGLVLSTPIGSTAYNKSLGGPVICEGVDVICATLIAPIQNSKTKDYITNTLISNEFRLEIISDISDIDLFFDGDEPDYNFDDLESIEISINSKKIKKINLKGTSYSENIKEKILKKNS